MIRSKGLGRGLDALLAGTGDDPPPRDSLQTLPLGVQNFSAEHSQDTAGILAFTSLAMLPALLFFSVAERKIVNSLQGAVKG